MIVLFAIALLFAFVSLVLASQLPAPAWIWALDSLGVSLAVAGLSGLGLLLARVRVPSSWAGLPLSSVSAVISLVTSRWVAPWLVPPEPMPRIDFWRIQLATLSIAGATFALIGGVTALSRSGGWYHMAAGGAIVTVGLYALAPLLVRAGVPIDWRAFLGLAGLGLGAFAAVEAARRAKPQ